MLPCEACWCDALACLPNMIHKDASRGARPGPTRAMAGSSGDPPPPPPPPPPAPEQPGLRSLSLSHWLPAESAAQRQQTAAVQRPAAGKGGWLEASQQRFKERWDSAWDHRWQPRASASAQPQDAPPADPRPDWQLRSAAEAREWVQTLDTVPMLGDCKHVWFCHGRPVVVR